MSRRIQIHQITVRPFPGSNYHRTELELVIYGPAGKASLQHDCENLVMAIADLINGGSHTARCGWIVNGENPKAKPDAMTVIHGWDKDYGRRFRTDDADKLVAREVIFDAGEKLSRGEVIWDATAHGTRTRSPLSHQVLYPTEMLRAAIEIIFHPPAPTCPSGQWDGDFAIAEPTPPARWIYKHEGD